MLFLLGFPASGRSFGEMPGGAAGNLCRLCGSEHAGGGDLVNFSENSQ